MEELLVLKESNERGIKVLLILSDAVVVVLEELLVPVDDVALMTELVDTTTVAVEGVATKVVAETEPVVAVVEGLIVLKKSNESGIEVLLVLSDAVVVVEMLLFPVDAVALMTELVDTPTVDGVATNVVEETEPVVDDVVVVNLAVTFFDASGFEKSKSNFSDAE